MTQLTTAEYAAMIGKSPRHVTHVLALLTILRSARPETEKGQREQEKRIKRRLNWLGDRYVSHEKKGNMYLITVEDEDTVIKMGS